MELLQYIHNYILLVFHYSAVCFTYDNCMQRSLFVNYVAISDHKRLFSVTLQMLTVGLCRCYKITSVFIFTIFFILKLFEDKNSIWLPYFGFPSGPGGELCINIIIKW